VGRSDLTLWPKFAQLEWKYEQRTYVAAELYTELCAQNVQNYCLKTKCLAEESRNYYIVTFIAKMEFFVCNIDFIFKIKKDKLILLLYV